MKQFLIDMKDWALAVTYIIVELWSVIHISTISSTEMIMLGMGAIAVIINCKLAQIDGIEERTKTYIKTIAAKIK